MSAAVCCDHAPALAVPSSLADSITAVISTSTLCGDACHSELRAHLRAMLRAALLYSRFCWRLCNIPGANRLCLSDLAAITHCDAYAVRALQLQIVWWAGYLSLRPVLCAEPSAREISVVSSLSLQWMHDPCRVRTHCALYGICACWWTHVRIAMLMCVAPGN